MEKKKDLAQGLWSEYNGLQAPKKAFKTSVLVGFGLAALIIVAAGLWVVIA